MRIYLATPCGGSILPATAICLMAMISETKLHRLNLYQDTYCDRAHNAIVEHALDTGSEAVIFIDSDQEFPADTANRLAARKKDIVGCAYRRRQAPFPLMPEGDGEGCQEVDWIPSGVMLVRTEVFKKMPFPWFPNFYGKKVEDFVGSDRSFCRRARSNGFKIFCDYDLSRQITHIASVALTFDGSIQSVGAGG